MTASPAHAYLVDASPYIFRAFFSLPSKLRDGSGRQSNAVYGFARFLLKLLTDERPDEIAVCFDGSLTTSFRNELYPDYKKQRDLPPASLEEQLGECQAAAEALGLACFIDPTFEADDLIASLCRPLKAAGRRLTIVSSDKDLAQLVDEQVDWLDAAKGQRLDPSSVKVKLGVEPAQIPDFLGLAGDAVDNIPGVRGVGPKTAVQLLERYSGLDALYARLDDVATSEIRGAKGLATRLHRQEEIARLSRRLARLSEDALESPDLERLSIRHLDPSGFKAFCNRLAFETLPDFLEPLLERPIEHRSNSLHRPPAR